MTLCNQLELQYTWDTSQNTVCAGDAFRTHKHPTRYKHSFPSSSPEMHRTWYNYVHRRANGVISRHSLKPVKSRTLHTDGREMYAGCPRTRHSNSLLAYSPGIRQFPAYIQYKIRLFASKTPKTLNSYTHRKQSQNNPNPFLLSIIVSLFVDHL